LTCCGALPNFDYPLLLKTPRLLECSSQFFSSPFRTNGIFVGDPPLRVSHSYRFFFREDPPSSVERPQCYCFLYISFFPSPPRSQTNEGPLFFFLVSLSFQHCPCRDFRLAFPPFFPDPPPLCSAPLDYLVGVPPLDCLPRCLPFFSG